jgi:hypothetical protein
LEEEPLLSTKLFTILGTSIVIIARVSSAIYSLLKTSFYTQLIGGSIVDETSYKLASISILGSFMIAAFTVMNMRYEEPVVFRESPSPLSADTFGKSSCHNHHKTCSNNWRRSKQTQTSTTQQCSTAREREDREHR